jgi:hypothetical protein
VNGKIKLLKLKLLRLLTSFAALRNSSSAAAAAADDAMMLLVA